MHSILSRASVNSGILDRKVTILAERRAGKYLVARVSMRSNGLVPSPWFVCSSQM